MFIRRTYNMFGEHQWLIALEGDCPVWSGCKRHALDMGEQEAKDALRRISKWKNPYTQEPISGMEIVE